MHIEPFVYKVKLYHPLQSTIYIQYCCTQDAMPPCTFHKKLDSARKSVIICVDTALIGCVPRNSNVVEIH